MPYASRHSRKASRTSSWSGRPVRLYDVPDDPAARPGPPSAPFASSVAMAAAEPAPSENEGSEMVVELCREDGAGVAGEQDMVRGR